MCGIWKKPRPPFIPTTATRHRSLPQASASFFSSLSAEQKAKYAWVSPESNRGWLSMGQEKLDGGLPDLKETFEIGRSAGTRQSPASPGRPR